MNKVFTLQQNEDILFKHNATLEKNGATGVMYVTSLRFAWIPIDSTVPNFMAAWGEVESDKYKTGKSGFCAMRIQTKAGDPKEFYLGEATQAVKNETENLRNAVKRAILGSRGGSTQSPVVATITPSRPGGISISKANMTTEHRRKELLLEADVELRKQFNDLVKGGIIDEDEFWATRSYLLDNEAGCMRQGKGIMSSLLADKAQTRTLNAEIIAEIFATKPIVKKVYNDKVPHELSEDEFWKKYFLSEMFTRHRATDVRTDDVFSRAQAEERARRRKEEQAAFAALPGSGPSSGQDSAGSNRKRPRAALDADLTSTFGDYVPPEPLDPEDFGLHREMSAVLEKYARKSETVMRAQMHGEETGSAEGGRRPLSEWGMDRLTELQTSGDPEYVPLHLKAPVVPTERGALSGQASSSSASVPLKSEVTSAELLSTLSRVLPTPQRAQKVFLRDIAELNAVQDKVRRAALHAAAAVSTGGLQESREAREVMDVPAGFEEFMRQQYISISEYLRHFYSIVQRSGLREVTKIEKIHTRLDQKLTEITNRKRALTDSSLSSSAELQNALRCIKVVTELIHRAHMYWGDVCAAVEQQC